MMSLISYAEEKGEARGRREGEARGEARGIKKGEDRLSKLIKLLFKNGRAEDVEKAADNEEYREELYKQFDL